MSSYLEPRDDEYLDGNVKETPDEENLRLLEIDLVRAEEALARLCDVVEAFLATHHDMPAHNDERCLQCAEARVALAFEEARRG